MLTEFVCLHLQTHFVLCLMEVIGWVYIDLKCIIHLLSHTFSSHCYWVSAKKNCYWLHDFMINIMYNLLFWFLNIAVGYFRYGILYLVTHFLTLLYNSTPCCVNCHRFNYISSFLFLSLNTSKKKYIYFISQHNNCDMQVHYCMTGEGGTGHRDSKH